MRKGFLIFSLILGSLMPVKAEPDYDQLVKLMVNADVESIISSVEKGHKTIKLGEKNSYLYVISLLVLGEIDKAESFLDKSLIKYPTSTNLKKAKQEILLYKRFFFNENPDPKWLDDNARKHLKIIGLMAEYQKTSNPSLKENIISLVKEIKTQAYLPTEIDYLLDLKDPELESIALKTIKEKQKILFPNGLDYYQLARTYRALAIIKNNPAFLDLAQSNIQKIKSIWIEEDIIISKPILKTQERITSFGFLIPQWILSF